MIQDSQGKNTIAHVGKQSGCKVVLLSDAFGIPVEIVAWKVKALTKVCPALARRRYTLSG
jgi:hypothetical protein